MKKIAQWEILRWNFTENHPKILGIHDENFTYIDHVAHKLSAFRGEKVDTFAV